MGNIHIYNWNDFPLKFDDIITTNRTLFQYPIRPRRRLNLRSRKVSKAAKIVFRIAWSLWNLTDTSAAVPPMCMSNFKYEYSNYQIRSFESSRDLTIRRLIAWWRHQMETFSALLALCAGNSPVPVNSPHNGQWRGALMFSLICARINGWVNNR